MGGVGVEDGSGAAGKSGTSKSIVAFTASIPKIMGNCSEAGALRFGGSGGGVPGWAGGFFRGGAGLVFSMVMERTTRKPGESEILSKALIKDFCGAVIPSVKESNWIGSGAT